MSRRSMSITKDSSSKSGQLNAAVPLSLLCHSNSLPPCHSKHVSALNSDVIDFESLSSVGSSNKNKNNIKNENDDMNVCFNYIDVKRRFFETYMAMDEEKGKLCSICYREMHCDNNNIVNYDLNADENRKIRFDFAAKFCTACDITVCLKCWIMHVTQKIDSYQMKNMDCLNCSNSLHYNTICDIVILDDIVTISKGPTTKECRATHKLVIYDNFLLQSCLALEHDLRWCPAPSCTFGCIASNCRKCPLIFCMREDCNTMFCYNCRAEWHTGPCDVDRMFPNRRRTRKRFKWPWKARTSNRDEYGDQPRTNFVTEEGEARNCPKCHSLVVKMNDGSCNHMSCVVCNCEFCWLCMKEVGDMHFISASGCTFWGKKRWSPERFLMCLFGASFGTPFILALAAALTVPVVLVGAPVYVTYRILKRCAKKTQKKRRFYALLGGFLSFILSPIFAAFIIVLGVPLVLIYVYIFMPIAIIRKCKCKELFYDTVSLESDSVLGEEMKTIDFNDINDTKKPDSQVINEPDLKRVFETGGGTVTVKVNIEKQSNTDEKN